MVKHVIIMILLVQFCYMYLLQMAQIRSLINNLINNVCDSDIYWGLCYIWLA